jgi:hypothetical protein
MPAGGSEFAAPAGDLRYGGPAGIAARMLAASPAGMPAVLALPRGIAVAAAWPAGGLARGRFAGGRLMTEAWSCGGPGQIAGRGGCRWRAEVPGDLGRLCRAAGEAHLTVSGSAVTLTG